MKTFLVSVLAFVVATFPTFAIAQTPVAMATWAVGVAPLNDAMLQSMRSITSAASATDFPGMVRGCRALKVSAQRYQAHLPSPDRALNVQLGGALADYIAAADYCVKGVQNLDTAAMQNATDHLGFGNTKLASASMTMQRYTR